MSVIELVEDLLAGTGPNQAPNLAGELDGAHRLLTSEEVEAVVNALVNTPETLAAAGAGTRHTTSWTGSCS